MFIETAFLFLLFGGFLSWWGIKAKDDGLFLLGCILFIGLGMELYATGLTTGNIEAVTSIKTIINGNTAYITTIQFSTLTIENEPIITGISLILMFIGLFAAVTGLQFIKREKAEYDNKKKY